VPHNAVPPLPRSFNLCCSRSRIPSIHSLLASLPPIPHRRRSPPVAAPTHPPPPEIHPCHKLRSEVAPPPPRGHNHNTCLIPPVELSPPPISFPPLCGCVQVLSEVARRNNLPNWETSSARGQEVLLDSIARVSGRVQGGCPGVQDCDRRSFGGGGGVQEVLLDCIARVSCLAPRTRA
jgi:hypothetical protein